MKLLHLATHNEHKIREWQELWDSTRSGWSLIADRARVGVVDETGSTFLENARLKALAWRSVLPRESWVVGEDSGFCVDALAGAPGLHSARFGGNSDSDRVQLILERLRDVPEGQRGAQFVCTLVLLCPKGEFSFSGKCEGGVASAPSGAGGFGYDPIFIPDGYTSSLAALGPQVKHSLSHRAAAIEQLMAFLRTN